jgi:tellurite resistance protein TerA
MAIDYTKRRPAAQTGSPAGSSGINYTKRSSASQPPPGQPVSLSKVTLTKSAPVVSLAKDGNASGLLRVNLSWDARPVAVPERGLRAALLGGRTAAIDLDLACLYEFTDGSKGAVQALGGGFTSSCTFTDRPVIRLDGDDRSGTGTAGENLFIDLAFTQQIRRVLVYAFIYEGAPNWAHANGTATVFPPNGPQVEVALDDHDPAARICAVALITGGAQLQVRREVRYFNGGQRLLDDAYGWGLRWQTGRK